MSSSYRNTLNEWLAGLEVKADRVLDIGGAQEQMPSRVKSWDVNKYLIADLPNPHKDSPKPDIELDLNEIWYRGEHRHEYDMVFCLEVFDYVWSPQNAFVNLGVFVKRGGTVWASFPSFYPLHQPVEDDALRYMPAGIEKLAHYANLQVVQMIKRRPETNLFEQFFRAERMRAAKHEDHNFTGFICEFKKG